MFGIKKKQAADARPAPSAAARKFSEDIASLDYANSQATAVPVRNFTQTVPRLTDEEKRAAYLHSGIIFKGVNRKARDALRKGFVVVPDVEDRDDAEELNATAREWMRRVEYKPKAIKALREMFVFGDGFLEVAYPGNASSEAAPAETAVPVGVFNVDPHNIRPVKDDKGRIFVYLSGPEVRTFTIEVARKIANGVMAPPAGVSRVHPKRIQHFQVNSLGEDEDGLGISVIEAAYINLLGKLAGDTAAGDILEWYSKGFFVVNLEFGTDEEIRAVLKQLEAAKKARKNYFVATERAKFDIKSPASPNVQQFYDNFYIEIAAALEMPTMVLMGVQKGTVTGSGTDLTEYYDEVHAFQTLLLEAPIVEMMRRVLKRTDINIEFAQLFVDKQTEADILFKRSQAGSVLTSILTRRQIVRYIRDGELPNPEDVPDELAEEGESWGSQGDPSAPEPSGPEAEPAAAGQDSKDEDEGSLLGRVLPLTDEDRARMKALRELGEEILRSGGAA